MAMYVNKKRKKTIWLSLLILLIVVAAGIFLYNKQPAKQYVTASPETKGPSSALPDKSAAQTGSKNSEDSNSSTSDSSPVDNNPPEKPTGVFISNHRPSLSGENLSNQINSVCTTTSGASCTITLTKDGKTISLPKQQTDNGGSTYWTWKLQDYGITEGTWKVKAVATLNGQTVSADDPTDMVVSK
jgi:hypothetical protein